MEKMKKKLNNKGFSLIELIIVISIMVVLIAVASATILRYIDRTRYGKDMSALDSLNTAVQAYVAENNSTIPGDDEIVSLKTLILGDGSVVYDPKNVIVSVLGETFEIKKTGDTITSCTFRAESNVFKDIDWEDVLVRISGGAISIVAPVNDGFNEKYVPYQVGTYQWSAGQKVKK